MNVSQIYATYVESKLIGVQAEETNLLVVRALQHVIQDVFAQLSATLVITIASQNWKIDRWFRHVLGELVSTWSSVSVQMLYINIPHVYQSPHVPGRKYCNLLLVDSYESLRSTQIAEDNANSDDHEYYFIFLQGPDKLVKIEMNLILNYCLNNFWLHCNVMVQTAQREVLIYTYFPYTTQSCQTAEPQLVNRFDGQRMLYAPLFPRKLHQLHQCPLNLVLWNAPPFVELSWDDQADELNAIGFEMTLIRHISKRLNFSLILTNVSHEAEATYQKSLGSVMSPLDMLVMRHANFSLGNFRKTPGRNRIVSSPIAHYYAPLVATVAMKHFRFGHLTMLHFPFRSCVWRFLLLAVLLHGLVYVWRWRHLGLQVLELLLGVTLQRLPQSWPQRIVYAHWLYGSIPLRVVYQSLLFHFIRLQLFETLPSTVEDLFAHNFRGMCSSKILSVLREIPQMSAHYQRFVSIPSTYDEVVLDSLHLVGDDRYFAITGLDTTNAHLTATNRKNSYHILRQYINVQQVVIYMPKHSYFTGSFNNILRQLDASGFIDFWRRSTFADYSRRISHQRGVFEELKDPHRNRQNDQLRQLIGIYTLTGVLYALAILVFCMELLCHRLSQ